MFEEPLTPSSSSSRNVLALVPTDPDWRPIFHDSSQVVLYNPTSHALSIRSSSNFPRRPRPPCPYCKQPLPLGFELDRDLDGHDESLDADPEIYSRASNYFHLLAVANETASRPSTPPPIASGGGSGSRSGSRRAFPAEAMAEGYFKAFFQEEARLGMGANGSVFLCQHVLDGNPLGHFAVKKIAVGESHTYLLNTLREVRLLERLHHPNIITYHHSWLETCQFSAFGPKVPTLHLLMQWAEGGSLDDFIDARLGRKAQHIHIHPLSTTFAPERPSNITSANSFSSDDSPSHAHSSSDLHSRSARIRAFRAYQQASPEEKERLREQFSDGGARGGGQSRQSWKPVHLLSAEETKSLFSDVVEGLAFLHGKSILHLDLKPGNVLLTWDEGRLIPRAMLSDFGTSRDMISSSVRSGNTGTLEYTSPESLPSRDTGILQQVDSKADMWSLGMILHKILFFKLPYRYAAAGDVSGEPSLRGLGEGEKLDRLEREVQEYAGFKQTVELMQALEGRRMPRAYLVLLETLLNPSPPKRPSSERVSSAVRSGRLDPIPDELRQRGSSNSSNNTLAPVIRRPSNENTHREEHPRESNEAASDASLQLDGEKSASFLGLPSPYQEPEPPPTPMWRRLLRPVGLRTLKSCILVFKVLNVATACRDFRSPAVGLALCMAVVDTWFDGLWSTVVFGLLHVLTVQAGVCRRD